MATLDKPIVRPLEVPWSASESSDGPRLLAGPEPTWGQTRVRCKASFSKGSAEAERWGSDTVVELVFESCQWASFYPEYSRMDEERIEGYDWGAVEEFRTADGSLKHSIERMRAQWKSSGICPWPNTYEIESSDIVQMLGHDSSEYRHFLVCGNDFNVEVVARSWSWHVAED